MTVATKKNFSFRHLKFLTLSLTIFSICAVGQSTSGYKVNYIKYFGENKKIIQDTTISVDQFPVHDIWNIIVNSDTLSNGIVPCNCRIKIYDSRDNLLEDIYDPNGDIDVYERSSYSYNSKGQLLNKEEKYGNLPWMMTSYFYDDKGRLIKEDQSSARYGPAAKEYIYFKDSLIYTIQTIDGRTDTIRVKK